MFSVAPVSEGTLGKHDYTKRPLDVPHAKEAKA